MRSLLKIFLGFLALAMLLATSTAAAQNKPNETPEFFSSYETLGKINSEKSWLGARNERAQDVLRGRLIDNKNKVIGQIEDIVFSAGGSIVKLQVDLNRMQGGSVLLDYSALGMKAVGSGYKTSYDDDQIKAMLPGLLAQLETAGGPAQPYSLKNIRGSAVITEDGRSIGKIRDVLFSDVGKQGEFLYIDVGGSGIKRGQMAIPFASARFESAGQNPQVKAIVSETTARAIAEYVSKGTRRFQPQ